MPGEVFTTAGELIGVVLASYGLIRESFATLGEARPFGEGRFGEGTFGGSPTPFATAVVKAAIAVHLVPGDGKLTLTDRKRNATFAILGSGLATISLIAELALILWVN